jgi:hypothetical protein
MEHLEGSLVSLNPEHLFKLNGTHSRSKARYEKGSPKPGVERLLAPIHDGPRSEAGVSFAVAATIDSRTVSKGVWCSYFVFMLFTIPAYEASRESLGIEVSNAGSLVWEVLLEFWQSFGYKPALAEFRHR